MATFLRRESGRWQARIRRDGKHVSRTFRTQADAVAWARKHESEVERGVWRDNQEAERCSLRMALDRYEAEVTPHKRSAISERSTLGIIREDASFLDVGLARIGSVDIAKLRDKWKRDEVKPATIRRRIALISHLFTIAAREWGMAGLANPVHNVSFESASDARSRRVSEEEVKAICDASESEELATFVRLALATGMRRGELVSLRWKNVDLKNKVAKVLTKKAPTSSGWSRPTSRMSRTTATCTPATCGCGRSGARKPPSVAWGSTPIPRTLPSKLIMSREECHGTTKKVQCGVQA